MKHLLQHFNNLTLHPKNAKALKGLILQLAVQGKLTENWRAEHPDVESGDVLLKRIFKEKNKSLKKKIVKRSNLDESEIQFKIPLNWTWCRLVEVGQTQTGNTPPKKNPSFYGDYIPFLGPANISNDLMNYPKNGLTKKGLQAGRFIPKNSLMMVCIGGSIGKCNINKIDVSCNQQINTITPIISHPVILKIICQSPYFQKVLINKSSGSATPIINKGKWEQILIPLPPLQEQKAIVAIVEELFAEVEQLEQKTQERNQLKKDYVTSALHKLSQTTDVAKTWQDLQTHFATFFNEKANIKSLRESILQLAVQGKLTAKWRKKNKISFGGAGGIESASELLKRITAEKKKLIDEKKIKKEKPLPKITEDEKSFELPEGWVWCRFGELITFLNGYAFKSSTYVSNSNNQVIRLGNVKNDRFLINTKEAYVPDTIANQALDYQLFKDDILTTLTGTKDKRDYCFTCIVKDEHLMEKNLLLNQRVGCIRAIDKSASELFNKFLKSKVILDQLFENETGTANQGNIGSTTFKNLIFPLPPLEEQKAIVQIVNELMAYCDGLVREVEQRDNLLEDLMASCLVEMEGVSTN